MSDTTIRITIDASGAQRGASQAERALDGVGNSSSRLNGTLGRTTVNVSTFSKSLAGIKGAGAAAILAGLTHEFIRMADASANMEAKLRLATKGFADYGQAQADVQRISAVTRSELTSTATLYGKLMTSGKALDATQGQIARATETVTKALKVSGATTSETASTVLQLGQALSSGKLNGDEFRSLAENAPRLMKLIADSMNVPVGALKKLASEGDLAADKLLRAFTDKRFTAALDEEFKQMPKTFGDAFTAMTNLATVAFGAFDKGGGFSQALYNFADQGNDNMKSIADAAYDAGAEIRDTFAGLSDAFEPLYNGAVAIFDALGIKAQSLRDQVAGILGAMDDAANAANRGSDLGGDILDAVLPKSVYDKSKDDTYGLQSNMRGKFVLGYARSHRDRARSRLEQAYKERTGRPVPKGWSDDRLMAESRNLGPAPRRTGGSGNLRPAPGSTTTPKKGGKSDAEREAERAAKAAERQKKAAEEFWQVMEENKKIASMMPIEAEKYTAEMDLQRVSGKALTDIEKQRLSTLMDETRAAKLLTDMRVANDNGKAELEFQKRKLGMTDKEAAMAEAAWEFESRALAEKVDISSALYQEQLAIVKARAGETFEIEKQNRLLKSREQLLAEYSPYEADRLKMEQFDADRERIKLLASKPVADGGITQEQAARLLDGLERGVTEVKNRWVTEMASSIDTLGNQISGKWGKAISKIGKMLEGFANAAKGDFSGMGPIGTVIDIIGKNSDGSLNGIGKAAAKASQNTMDQLLGRNGQKSALLNPLKSMGDGFKGFQGDMKKIFTGKGPGSVAGAIGNSLGKVAGGVQMGQQADALLKSLGVQSSKLGAQIGGGIGSLVGGPIGGLIGSFGGGLIGGLFKKKSYGTSKITLGEDGYLDAETKGNKSGHKEAAKGAAGAVISGLDAIAEQLGGTISGNPTVSIGKYKDKWRVSTTGRTGKLKGGSNRRDIHDFGKDGEEEAISFAIKTALKQGVLTGVTDFSKRILSAAKDIDRAVNLATKYENIVKQLARIDDPIGEPLKELNEEFSKLRKEMIANKATAEELANVDRYYMVQRENMLKEQLSSLKSFRDKLMGEGSGISKKSRLDSKLAEFANYETALSQGKSVDTAAMTALGSDIWDMTKDIYGTATAQSQNIRNRLLEATDGATKYVEGVYANNQTNIQDALNTQTEVLTEQLKAATKANGFWERILEIMEQQKELRASLPGMFAVNGKQQGTV